MYLPLCFCFLFCDGFCDNVKISIIVPVYNREKYVYDCLKSITNQTLKELQIIAVDDGSSDGSLQIMNGLADVDTRVLVIHQKNGGVSSAQNTGLAAATGEYVTFVDSDDVLINADAYRIAYEKAKEKKVDVVVWGLLDGSKNDKSWLMCDENTYYQGIDSTRFFLPQHNAITSVKTKMYLREMLSENNITFDTSTQFGEDLLFNFDLVPIVDSVYCINQAFYYYTHLPEGLDRGHRVEDEDTLNAGIFEHMKKLRNDAGCKNRVSKEDVKGVEGYLEERKNKTEMRRKWIKTKFALLTVLYGERHDYWDQKGDYGDCFQSFAVENVYNEMGIPYANLAFVNRGGIDLYKGEPVVVILQGWFDGKTSLLWSPKITPVFLGFRLQQAAQKKFLTDGTAERMKKLGQPIGCGDIQTADFLKSAGVYAYYSGCLTMTLPRRKKEQIDGKVFIADVLEVFLPRIPTSLRRNAEFVHLHRHESVHIGQTASVDFEAHARNMLDRFKAEARLLLTSRVDVAMPCVALGIPVIFLHTDSRDSCFDVLKGVIEVNTLENIDTDTVDWHPTVANISKIQDLIKSNAKNRIEEAVLYYEDYKPNKHRKRSKAGGHSI